MCTHACWDVRAPTDPVEEAVIGLSQAPRSRERRRHTFNFNGRVVRLHKCRSDPEDLWKHISVGFESPCPPRLVCNLPSEKKTLVSDSTGKLSRAELQSTINYHHPSHSKHLGDEAGSMGDGERPGHALRYPEVTDLNESVAWLSCHKFRALAHSGSRGIAVSLRLSCLQKVRNVGPKPVMPTKLHQVPRTFLSVPSMPAVIPGHSSMTSSR